MIMECRSQTPITGVETDIYSYDTTLCDIEDSCGYRIISSRLNPARLCKMKEQK